MTASAQETRPRLNAFSVLAETGRGLAANASWALKLGWLAVAVQFVADVVYRTLLPEGLAWTLLPIAVPLPFWLMVCVAWHRLLIEGPERVTAPPLRLERTHGRYFLKLVLFFVVFALLTVLAVLPMGAVELDLRVAAAASGVAVWLVLTLLTPLLLNLPGEAVGRGLPRGAWQGRLANIAQGALVWLPFMAVAAVLTVWRGSPAEGEALNLAGGLWLAVEVLVDYILLLIFLTLLSVIYRQLSGANEQGGRA